MQIFGKKYTYIRWAKEKEKRVIEKTERQKERQKSKDWYRQDNIRKKKSTKRDRHMQTQRRKRNITLM
jgi:hypothetical protein